MHTLGDGNIWMQVYACMITNTNKLTRDHQISYVGYRGGVLGATPHIQFLGLLYLSGAKIPGSEGSKKFSLIFLMDHYEICYHVSMGFWKLELHSKLLKKEKQRIHDT